MIIETPVIVVETQIQQSNRILCSRISSVNPPSSFPYLDTDSTYKYQDQVANKVGKIAVVRLPSLFNSFIVEIYVVIQIGTLKQWKKVSPAFITIDTRTGKAWDANLSFYSPLAN